MTSAKTNHYCRLSLQIDLQLISEQKGMLLRKAKDGKPVSKFEMKEVDGLINFIDAIQDYLVDSGQLSEYDVFGFGYKDRSAGWVCTDPSCDQYQKKVAGYVYEMREMRTWNPDTGETKPYCSTIDLRDYDLKDIFDMCQTYGYGPDSVIEMLSNNDQGVIAECIFELET